MHFDLIVYLDWEPLFPDIEANSGCVYTERGRYWDENLGLKIVDVDLGTKKHLFALYGELFCFQDAVAEVCCRRS